MPLELDAELDACATQVEKHEDSQAAAMAVCVEAYRAWLTTEARTDDITVIIVEFQLSRGLTCAHTPLLLLLCLGSLGCGCRLGHLAQKRPAIILKHGKPCPNTPKRAGSLT